MLSVLIQSTSEISAHILPEISSEAKDSKELFLAQVHGLIFALHDCAFLNQSESVTIYLSGVTVIFDIVSSISKEFFLYFYTFLHPLPTVSSTPQHL